MAIDPSDIALQQQQNALAEEHNTLLNAAMSTEQGRLTIQGLFNEGIKIGTVFWDRLKNAMHGANVEAAQTNDIFAIIGKNLQLNDLVSVIEKAKGALLDLGKDGAFSLLPLLDALPATRDLFGQLGDSGMKAGSSIHDAFSKITEIPLIQKQFGTLAPAIDRVFTAGDKAQNMQFGLIALAAASGNLNKVMESTGDNFHNLTDFAANYNQKVFETANASGMLTSTVAKYAAQLGVIPGATETVIATTDTHGHALSELTASVKIASAFQMDHQDVVNQLNFAYRDFNTTGEKALQFVASMAQTSQDLAIPMDIVSKTTMEASKSFMLLGDNSQAAMNVLANVSDALKGSNIGPEGIAQITGDMIGGIRSLDVATKAFISSQSGGRGGLAGAFQIDQMLQQGKLDEVLQMTQRAMKNQFGGSVVTLEDANKNPNQSGQLLKEMEFLKNVAHLAKSDDEAYRILEIMKKGGPGGDAFKGIRTAPQEALEKAVGQGSSIQQKGFNELTNISNEILKVEMVSAASSLELTRKLLGTEGKGQTSIDLKKKMDDSVGTASFAKKTTLDEQQKGIVDGITGSIQAVKNMMGNIPDFATMVLPFNKTKTEVEKIPNNTIPNLNTMPPTVVNNQIQSVNNTAQQDLFSTLGLGPSKPTIAPPTAQTVLAPPEMTQVQKNQASNNQNRNVIPKQQGTAQMNGQTTDSDGTIHVIVDVHDGVTKIARAEAKKVVDKKFSNFNGIQGSDTP